MRYLAALLLTFATPLVAEPLELTQFAGSDLIKHPTGCTFTPGGDLLVIESHSHFRPDDYVGPESDQLVILRDTDADGVADERSLFYGKDLIATMDIATHPTSGIIFVATRNEILRLREVDGKAELIDRKFIDLQTTADYPHNGISGLCFSPNGDTLYFGMGENFGADFVIEALGDGSTIRDSEAGKIFSVSTTGTGLRQVATGFWNPYGVTCSPEGHLFATDNDPSSRPPSRLHHIVEGGDYGYQYRYGRSGQHPFISWDGELPGHLPMLAGSGEAPCDVIVKDGNLLVASWADHRLESYPLTWEDGAFETKQKIAFQGADDFRPVAFAEASNGDLFVTDWVKSDYKLHGEGAVWVIRGGWNPEPRPMPTLEIATASDPLKWSHISAPDTRLLQAKAAGEAARLPGLIDASPLLGLKWISDDLLVEHRSLAERYAAEPATPTLYHAAITALARLDGEAVDDKPIQKRLAAQILSPGSSDLVKRSAFLILSDREKVFSIAELEEIFRETDDEELKTGVLLTLLTHPKIESAATLREQLAGESDGVLKAFAEMAETPTTQPVPEDWMNAMADLEGEPDPAKGRRIFHGYAMCASCHGAQGYGSRGGPDLTGIASESQRGEAHVIASIVDPSAEVAPQYEAWQLSLKDGTERLVFMLGQQGGKHVYVDIAGKTETIDYRDIVKREQMPVSLMPPHLDKTMTASDMRDLLSFLAQE